MHGEKKTQNNKGSIYLIQFIFTVLQRLSYISPLTNTIKYEMILSESKVKGNLNRIYYLFKQLVTYRGEMQAICNDVCISCDGSYSQIHEPDRKRINIFFSTLHLCFSVLTEVDA